MDTIWKYPLEVVDVQVLDMPKDAKILSVDVQGDQLCLWAWVGEKAPLSPRCIRIYGTGHRVSRRPQTFIGTALVAGGSLVWHVFEERVS